MQIDRVGDRVVIVVGGERCVLTAHQAFEKVTRLLVAIDGARAYGQYRRGEVPEPDRHKRP